ncbi:zf-TFIIB domain-containing protein [Desulfovermiculus halophilus]|uniref:TFIIB-type zinc ribbon-containing protein n=1 Tax=Desulfovermiculus halophilus TaxID=339722 RepID=UPI0004854249|nr:zf-TFIIB domain-containing protein [Desulfovermiculus halophilus]
MKCPVCKDTNLVMTDRQGIEIDYCPECRGVWLDRGELDKIIERTMSEQAPSMQENDRRDQGKHHDKEDRYEKKKKKKSLLGELLDF